MISDDDVEDAVDGVMTDEGGLSRGSNEGGSDGYTRHQHGMAPRALENNNTVFADGNDLDVDNVEDTIDAPIGSEKQV